MYSLVLVSCPSKELKWRTFVKTTSYNKLFSDQVGSYTMIEGLYSFSNTIFRKRNIKSVVKPVVMSTESDVSEGLSWNISSFIPTWFPGLQTFTSDRLPDIKKVTNPGKEVAVLHSYLFCFYIIVSHGKSICAVNYWRDRMYQSLIPARVSIYLSIYLLRMENYFWLNLCSLQNTERAIPENIRIVLKHSFKLEIN